MTQWDAKKNSHLNIGCHLFIVYVPLHLSACHLERQVLYNMTKSCKGPVEEALLVNVGPWGLHVV